MAKAITTSEGETLLHRILWRCCLLQIESARVAEKGRMYFDLSAMLMAYLTYEAYLNFVGTRVAQCDWENEREFFRKAPYKGTEGKLKRIIEVCGLPAMSMGTRPYQTIKQLAELRDFIAHAKPDRYSEHAVDHPMEVEPPMFEPNRLE